jgi:hypothetical protein
LTIDFLLYLLQAIFFIWTLLIWTRKYILRVFFKT